MALSINDSADPQPQSGHGPHSQESGDAGLSIDMVHDFSGSYEETQRENTPDKSSVIPITVPHDNVFEKPLSLKLCPEEDVARFKINPSPTLTSFHNGEEEVEKEVKKEKEVEEVVEKEVEKEVEVEEEEAVELLPRSSEANVKKAGEADCTTSLEMETRASQGNDPEMRPEIKRRNNRKNRQRKKKVILGFLAAVGLVVTVGILVHQFVASQQTPSDPVKNQTDRVKKETPSNCRNCFACLDSHYCPLLTAIYKSREDEFPISPKKLGKTFPGCSDIKPPANNTCSVCSEHDDIRICCSDDITGFVAEHSGGGEVKNISRGCTSRSEPTPNGTPTSGNLGRQAPAFVFIIILLGAQLIFID